MKLLRFQILIAALALLPLMMHGQELPSLPTAAEITKGSLPNGMDFYLVSNPLRKGFADFALLQRGGHDAAHSTAVLDSLQHFGSRKPYAFLADNGVGYTSEGLAMHLPDALMFSFRDVPVTRSVSDSTLLALFDMAATFNGPQAIMVSGDIDRSAVLERMKLLSMIVPRIPASGEPQDQQWEPRDSLTFALMGNSTNDVAAINAIYSARRLPRELLNTPQPIITRTYSEILGNIVHRRLAAAFENTGVPLADVRFSYVDSSEGYGQERYSITVFTSAGRLDEALRLLASVLSAIDHEGVGTDEFEFSRDAFLAARKRGAADRKPTNSDYMDKCAAAYLYGANLASEATIDSYVARRSISSDKETELFNGFASALLDSAKALTLRIDAPHFSLDREVAAASFNRAWSEGRSGGKPVLNVDRDSLRLYQPVLKTRVTGEKTEPLSGGKMWTFSNGIRVLYKRTADKDEFRYALLLRGGVAAVPGLLEGESAFVADMLPLSRVAGMSGKDFRAMLEEEGITMDQTADLSGLTIRGIAPSSKLDLLMRSLLSMAQSRTPDPQAFMAYREAEAIRIDMGALSPRNVKSVCDSIMRPSYFYTERKDMDKLHDDLPEKAEKYFRSQFSKVNDGMLVLMGDLDETALKKYLCRTLGDFQTSKNFSRRPVVGEGYTSGSVTYIVESAPGIVGGGERGVSVAMSAPMQMSTDSHVTLRVAAECVRRALVRQLAAEGAYVEVSGRIEIFPAERMTLYVSCHPGNQAGMPAGVNVADPLALLGSVRQVTLKLGSIRIDDADLDAAKAHVSAIFEARSGSTDALMDDILVRYSDGKDLMGGAAAAVRNVTADKVRTVLESLAAGAGVEYVII